MLLPDEASSSVRLAPLADSPSLVPLFGPFLECDIVGFKTEFAPLPGPPSLPPPATAKRSGDPGSLTTGSLNCRSEMLG